MKNVFNKLSLMTKINILADSIYFIKFLIESLIIGEPPTAARALSLIFFILLTMIFIKHDIKESEC